MTPSHVHVWAGLAYRCLAGEVWAESQSLASIANMLLRLGTLCLEEEIYFSRPKDPKPVLSLTGRWCGHAAWMRCMTIKS